VTFRLRPATPADLPAIAELNVAAARAAYEHIAGREALAALEPAPGDWAPRLASASIATVAVAVEDGAVVGFAFSGRCELRSFFTHPRVWGAGAGRALLASAEEALRREGCRQATLWTEERNHRPLRVYEAAGWRRDGSVKERKWLGTPIRELRLRKRL
jgi:GNAT superfamily N-acetyltransferase